MAERILSIVMGASLIVGVAFLFWGWALLLEATLVRL